MKQLAMERTPNRRVLNVAQCSFLLPFCLSDGCLCNLAFHSGNLSQLHTDKSNTNEPELILLHSRNTNRTLYTLVDHSSPFSTLAPFGIEQDSTKEENTEKGYDVERSKALSILFALLGLNRKHQECGL